MSIKAKPVVMPKQEENRIIIPASIKAAVGHEANVRRFGCGGIHRDKRTKRLQTRANRNRKAISDWQ